jgi:hypothetical protein
MLEASSSLLLVSYRRILDEFLPEILAFYGLLASPMRAICPSVIRFRFMSLIFAS